MKIYVLSGSPKGEESVTMQYVRFLEMAEPQHSFFVYQIGHFINRLEKDRDAWDALIADIRVADLILWATPVYYLLVPAQLKRFIELVSERKAGEAFKGKYAASITTSVHFFDNLAHEYLQGISEDLGMRWAGSFSAEMNDLMDEKNQHQLVLFGDDIIAACEKQRPVQKMFLPLPGDNPQYLPKSEPDCISTTGKNVLILHDAGEGSNLGKMVEQMAGTFKGDVTVFALDDTNMKGGCLGCVQCAFDNTCVYRDGYASFWKEHIIPADILIYAGTIQDRYLSSQWKQFFDRSFIFGHIPRYSGKQVVFLIQGPLSYLPGLRENLESLCKIGGANLVNVITDESENPDEIDSLIRSAAERAILYAEEGFQTPPMFQAVGGHKIFRDMIWGDLRPIFKADHRFYRSHGLYDFPQKQYAKRITTWLFSLFLDIPAVQRRAKPMMKEKIISGYSRVFTDNPLIRERRRG